MHPPWGSCFHVPVLAQLAPERTRDPYHVADVALAPVYLQGKADEIRALVDLYGTSATMVHGYHPHITNADQVADFEYVPLDALILAAVATLGNLHTVLGLFIRDEDITIYRHVERAMAARDGSVSNAQIAPIHASDEQRTSGELVFRDAEPALSLQYSEPCDAGMIAQAEEVCGGS